VTDPATLERQRQRARRTAMVLAVIVAGFYAVFVLKHLL
jgi:predicted nucleic acid-binding Zn ribbon protein